jgi:hypothetical protein
MIQNYEQQYKLSKFINLVRGHLLGQGFFEHHLYSTLNYKIENTDTFKIKENLYLRYNPEPDIWQVGMKHDNFFWIGSMFRDEKELSNLHRNEFTVVDIYQSKGQMKDVVDKFLELLHVLEKNLDLSSLSHLDVRYITHDEFNKINKKELTGKYWLVVTDYLTEESFYDEGGADGSHTQKFEIFFVSDGDCTEIAACGKLGNNLNNKNFITTDTGFLNENLLNKRFIGFGFGLERLIKIYE